MERTDDVKRNTFGVLVASAVAAFAAIALIAVLFRRWITQPLAQIGESARALSSDETQQLPDFDSAELQEVVDAIRTLQGSLAHERDRAVTAYRALEQSAVLAVHVRSELADELGDPPPGMVGRQRAASRPTVSSPGTASTWACSTSTTCTW